MRRRSGRRFLFSLAAELGYANPDAMASEMTSRQIAEWVAWFKLRNEELEKQGMSR